VEKKVFKAVLKLQQKEVKNSLQEMKALISKLIFTYTYYHCKDTVPDHIT
jgi:hypothetical protein